MSEYGAYGARVHTEIADGITYNVYIEQDESPVRGNAIASGDDEYDAKVEDEILERLNNGDIWAWAFVTVEASFMGLSDIDQLGGCCYRDAKEFLSPDGYYPGMKGEALGRLYGQAKKAAEVYTRLREIVK